jgi:magnesium-transporting ATPase (P-type)
MLYRFEGTFSPLGSANEKIDTDIINLDYNNFLLRGSMLKNTEWIIGMVIYTGHDTKIMQNASIGSQKFSHNDYSLNKMIMSVFLIQLFLVVLFSVFEQNWEVTNA